jgi:cytochrome c
VRRRALLRWLAWGLVLLAAGGCFQQNIQPLEWQVPGDAALGRSAIAEYGCLSCHAVPGIPGADAVVGPPLTNMGERRTIAGRLANTPANMAAWIENPQDVDPGNLMPDVGVSPEDALNITAFLYGLRE